KEREERALPPLPAVQDAAGEGVHGELNAQREADRIAVNRFAPPGVLINEQLQILQFRGSTGAYLQPPSGKASFDVLKMARPGLMLPLREAINQAKKENQPARRDNVRIKGNGERRTASVEVIPLKNLRERCFFVLFEDAQGEHRPAEPKPAAAERLPPDEASERIGELETELAETRDYLQSTQEQQEAANEELQAVNEEAQSGNEELQSINEELETSKEELESSNEELATVNEEMVNRNTTLDRLNNDLTNLQTSIRLTIVLLGRDLSIRRFSAHAEKELGLRDSDLGRPIGHIRHNLVLDPEAEETAALDLEHHLEEVIAKVHDETLEVRDKAGRWYSLRLRPYRTVDNKVDGAVLVLMDIDALKRSEQAIAVARDYAENVVETVREPLLVLDDDLRVESANRAFYRTFRVAPAETHGKLIFELGNHQWDIPRLQKLLEQLLPQNTSLEDFEVEHDFEQVGRRTMLLNARRILDPQRKTQRILLAIEDVTEHKAAQAALRESEARFREMIDVLPTAIYTTDTEGRLTHFNPATVELSGHTPKLGTDQWCVSWKLYRADGTPMPHAACAMAVALREERAIHGEEAILERPDGTRRWFVPYPTPLRDAGGRVVGGINMLVDITERKRAEEANVRLAVIVESSDDVIVSKDLEGIIQTWNAGAQRTFGYTAEEAIGQPITMLLPPDRIGEEPGILKRVRRGERVEPFETVRRRKDGTLVDIAVTISPILDAQGRVLGASKIARDITERKRAEDKLQRSEQRYRGLFESARDGILILDAQNMRITDANPSMRNLLSYSLEQLEGKELWEIGLFQNQEESLATIHKLREEGYVRHEDMTLRSAQGAIQNVQLIGNIYRDHGHAFAQCNIRDITERKRMERQIQQQAEELAAAGRRKDEFLAMLSHELRNPLAPILNALQLLGQERDENALHRRARGVIERQVRHLSRLVNELLDVSRITSGRIHLHIERLAVNAVLGRAVERVRPSIDRRGQELSLSLAPDTIWLDADATRLEQVFGNLLDNASKYNADDGHITLSVERDDGQAIIRVRDEGEGIDAATLSHVFELFSQAERSLERSAGGLGIGLALVKSIVELHRGSVEVHSEGLGQGSEFVVRLPLASSQTRPQAAAAPPDTPTDGDSHLRVLVVDDSADAANMATLLLRAWGHEVRVACDGPDALQRAAEFCPQVILLDIGLPGMDGFEVARSIRQDPQFEGVRLVAITGYGQDSDRQRSKEAGFDDHLVKPVEVSDLKALLGGFRQEAVDPEMDPGLRGVTSKSA
ncbi:MAG: PAS domain S-box protein, partial [Nitrococcus sp.]|nr:PAS domain S-box protein [Nitrococcus sp.]